MSIQYDLELRKHVHISNKNLVKLSFDVDIDKISGNFLCHDNHLTSLEGCPSQVGGHFYCHYNQLTSLEHCPSYVNGDLVCRNNKLISLQDIHKYINKIGKEFNCENNPIKSHILGLMWIEISGNIKTGLGNGTGVDAVLNKWKNQGRRGIMGAMKELIDLGYEELAQL